VAIVTDRGRKTDPRSPVQPGPSNVPYLLLAFVVAISTWTFWQYRIQHSNPSPITQQTETPRTMTGLFSADDYPPEALDRGEQGTVGVRVGVDTSGRVSTCAVLESSGSQTLDRATCKIIEARARFRPARDADGQAVQSSVTQKIVWRIAE